MAKKPATRAQFTLFDVVYEDGSVRSNRRVPSEVLGGLDGDAPARAVIEEQDQLIAEKSGTPSLAVKSIHRSGTKKPDEVDATAAVRLRIGLMTARFQDDLFGASSAETLNPDKVPGPKMWVSGTSAASRPRAMRIRPIRGTLLRGSKVCHRPPR